MGLIYSTPMRRDGTNRICRKVSSGGIFEVKSYYKVLHSIAKLAFPWKLLWKPKVPNKFSFSMDYGVGKKIKH